MYVLSSMSLVVNRVFVFSSELPALLLNTSYIVISPFGLLGGSHWMLTLRADNIVRMGAGWSLGAIIAVIKD